MQTHEINGEATPRSFDHASTPPPPVPVHGTPDMLSGALSSFRTGQHDAGAARFLKYEDAEAGQERVEQSSGLEAYLASEAHGVCAGVACTWPCVALASPCSASF